MAKNDVVVKITQKQVAGTAGFGVPLIIQGMGTAAKEYAEYGSLDEVMEAGFTQDHPIYGQCLKLFMQNDRPAKVAICVGTGKVTETLNLIKEKDFRQVIPIFGDEGDDTLKDLATYIETTEDKMLIIKAADVSELSAIGKLDRTMAVVYAGSDEGVEGALVGATAGLTVGSFTYKNVIIKGIEPDPLTDAQIEAVHKAGGICIVRKAGDIVTSEGTVMSGEYADIIDCKDYIIKNIAYKSQKLLNSSPKLAFDNTGISQLEGVVTNVLKDASIMGIIAVDDDGVPLYATDFDSREETSGADRASRTYKGGRFSFDLAGAIHYATINGTIEV
nr:MAG TPA: tail sheath protein [Caudoviricetes sp.]